MKAITLSGPGMNALGSGLMQRLIADLDEAAGQPVLLTGAGKAFSAGLDLQEIASLDAPGLENFLEILERLVEDLYRYPGPVAAAVNGHAIAGGCVLTLCSDYRVIGSSPKIRVGLNEAAIGVTFPPRTLRAVVDRLPPRHRDVVLLGGQLYPPEAALELGLVDRIADDPVAEATAWLELVGAHEPSAYANTKLSVRDPLDLPDADWHQWVEGAMRAWTSADAKARIAKLLAR